MSRRTIATITREITLAILVLFAALWITAAGRQTNATASRNACYRAALRNTAQVNALRAEATITNSKQDQRTINIAATILDQQTNQQAWTRLTDPADQQIVRDGSGGHQPYECANEFPNARLIP